MASLQEIGYTVVLDTFGEGGVDRVSRIIAPDGSPVKDCVVLMHSELLRLLAASSEEIISSLEDSSRLKQLGITPEIVFFAKH